MTEQYRTPVHVNGHVMNVYVAGTGERTIVFLAGAWWATLT